jgi:hypothetical protein
MRIKSPSPSFVQKGITISENGISLQQTPKKLQYLTSQLCETEKKKNTQQKQNLTKFVTVHKFALL